MNSNYEESLQDRTYGELLDQAGDIAMEIGSRVWELTEPGQCLSSDFACVLGLRDMLMCLADRDDLDYLYSEINGTRDCRMAQ